jgi:hypothetical protein
MSDKYVIAWWEQHTMIYFKELLFKSSDWDTYGTSPEPKVERTDLLSEARVFDTIDKADTVFYKINEHVKGDVSFVMPVSEKDIFNAKLKDE